MTEDVPLDKGLCCLCFPSFLPIGEKWFQGYCQLGNKNSLGIFATGILFTYITIWLYDCYIFSNLYRISWMFLFTLTQKKRLLLEQRCFSWMHGAFSEPARNFWFLTFAPLNTAFRLEVLSTVINWDTETSQTITFIDWNISLKDPEGGFARFDLSLIDFRTQKEINCVVESHGGE